MDVLEREEFLDPKICYAIPQLLGSFCGVIEEQKERGRHRSKPAHKGFKDRPVARTHVKSSENRNRELL
jgi:hypothetical protein